MKTGTTMSDWDSLLIAIESGTKDQMLDQIVNVIGNMVDKMIETTDVDRCGTYGCIAQNMIFRMANMNHKDCAKQLIREVDTQLDSFTNQTQH
jgi:hypothetical protein